MSSHKPKSALGSRLRLFRKARQRAVLEIMRRWSNWRKVPTEAYQPEKIHSILVPLPGDTIGESLMATLFLKTVKAHRPDVKITVASGPQTASLFADCESVDSFISVGNQTMSLKTRMNALIEGIRKKKQFDLVADMRTGLNVRIFSFLRKINAKHYLGHAKNNYALFDLNVSPEVQHTSERWLAASQMITGRIEQPSKCLTPQDFCLPANAKEHEIDQWQETLPPSRGRILFNLYGSSPHRSFQYPEALKLLRLWLERFPNDLLQLLPIPGHEHEVKRLVKEIDDEQVVVPPSPLSLPTSFTLTRRADLVFTPDTGMVHIASSLNTPIIAIYDDNPQNFSEWKPLSDLQTVIFTRPPTALHERVSIHEFDYAEMWTAVESLLARHDVFRTSC